MIGYETSEVLDVKPAEYFVELTKREKRACKKCEEQGVVAAPLAARIIDKSLVSDRVIIDTLVKKYADHCPLYRQSSILKRDTGIEISRATMCGWIMRVGELLIPRLPARCVRSYWRRTYIQADETPVDVQTQDEPRNQSSGLSVAVRNAGRSEVFDFRMSRGREGPTHFLDKFEGILQTDDYAAYDRGVGGANIVHACCWGHARRHFVDAVKLNRQDVASIRAVELMDELFAIDAQARDDNMDHARRHALATAASSAFARPNPRAHPGDEQTVLPSSKAGQACSYTLATLDAADTLPRPSRTGTEQQSCRKFDASSRPGPIQLDPYRQPTRRPTHRSNLLRG